MTFGERLSHAWNAFLNKEPVNFSRGISSSYRPDRIRLTRGNERSIINSVICRIAMDSAAVDMKHVILDENFRFVADKDSGLNNCLTLEANKDQTARAFMQDIVTSMLDEGTVAIVPVDTVTSPKLSNSYDILSLRTAKIIEWFPDSIRVRIYNDRTGTKEEMILPKKMVCIVDNPFYSVMNEPNSTLQRLIRKLNLLDTIDEKTGANKLDLIIQLPYIIKSEARRKQAEDRRKDIEAQLSGSKYGIAYTDGTEHITQLNRSVDNQLLSQVEYLTNMFFSQLGITAEILNGTANADAMNNYYSRTIEPILSAIADEMKRKFLTKTARTQGQSIEFFRDPFKLVPVSAMAELADKFTRNEIMTANEIRQIVGMKPANDPGADELRNKNISAASDQVRYDEQGNLINEYGEPEQGNMPYTEQPAEEPMAPNEQPVNQDDETSDPLIDEIVNRVLAQLGR